MNVKIKTPELDSFLRAVKKAHGYKVVVGILHDHESREQSTVTNAQVGAVHEFGSPAKNIPVRSFLRMPITTHFSQALKESKLFKKEELKKIIKEKKLIPWLKRVGITAEKVVREAFDSNGFGTWAPWKGDYKSKTGLILVDTQQLRDSITSEVRHE